MATTKNSKTPKKAESNLSAGALLSLHRKVVEGRCSICNEVMLARTERDTCSDRCRTKKSRLKKKAEEEAKEKKAATKKAQKK
ncbi:MAG: hypothetical protein ACJAS1_002493 [Oleiphilaceae bacterium]